MENVLTSRLMISKSIFILCLVFCVTPWCSGALALLMGLVLSFSMGHPFLASTKKYTSQLLQLSVVGLGAGMNLKVVAEVGLQGFGYTVVGILTTALIGVLLLKILKTEAILSTLITVGTAICGGSAIAAVSPIVGAKDRDISISLATIFVLNAIALLVFPSVGHYFSLTQNQFGLWAALAIHDTSSVVGASLQYGPEALQVATTVKLARALWIIPVSFSLVFAMGLLGQKSRATKTKKPWFIFGFLLLAALVTYLPALADVGIHVSNVAKKFLVVTLFLIGSGLSLNSLKEVGLKPLLFGLILWILVSSLTLLFIVKNLITA